MSETNPKNYKKGDRLFICDRYADGKYQIGLVTIADVIERLTPKGNPKPPKYVLHLETFSINGKRDITETGDITFQYKYFTSPVDAVKKALKEVFDGMRKEETPEERLLKAIYGESPSLKIALDELPQVIRDLRGFEVLIAEAYKLDAKLNGEDGDENGEVCP